MESVQVALVTSVAQESPDAVKPLEATSSVAGFAGFALGDGFRSLLNCRIVEDTAPGAVALGEAGIVLSVTVLVATLVALAADFVTSVRAKRLAARRLALD